MWSNLLQFADKVSIPIANDQPRLMQSCDLLSGLLTARAQSSVSSDIFLFSFHFFISRDKRKIQDRSMCANLCLDSFGVPIFFHARVAFYVCRNAVNYNVLGRH